MRKVSVSLLFVMVSMAFWGLSPATSHVLAAVATPSVPSAPNLIHDQLSSMSGMSDGMGYHVFVQNPALSYFEVGIISIGVAIVVVAAFLSFTRRSKIKRPLTKTNTIGRIDKSFLESDTQSIQGTPTLYPFVLKALTDEERQIVNILTCRDGKCLQKDIREITGLGAQTNSIVSRLIE